MSELSTGIEEKIRKRQEKLAQERREKFAKRQNELKRSGSAKSDLYTGLSEGANRPKDARAVQQINQMKTTPKPAGDTLDYGKMRKDFQDKAKAERLARRGSKGLKKALKSVPVLGPMAMLAMGSPEDVAASVMPDLLESEDVGMSGLDEDIMLSEIKAEQDYRQSPAGKDAAYRKLMNRMRKQR